jgi:hypothetical protein
MTPTMPIHPHHPRLTAILDALELAAVIALGYLAAAVALAIVVAARAGR